MRACGFSKHVGGGDVGDKLQRRVCIPIWLCCLQFPSDLLLKLQSHSPKLNDSNPKDKAILRFEPSKSRSPYARSSISGSFRHKVTQLPQHRLDGTSRNCWSVCICKLRDEGHLFRTPHSTSIPFSDSCKIKMKAGGYGKAYKCSRTSSDSSPKSANVKQYICWFVTMALEYTTLFKAHASDFSPFGLRLAGVWVMSHFAKESSRIFSKLMLFESDLSKDLKSINRGGRAERLSKKDAIS